MLSIDRYFHVLCVALYKESNEKQYEAEVARVTEKPRSAIGRLFFQIHREIYRNQKKGKQQEEQKFLQRLEAVAERKREMERRYKLISKLHPNRLNSFLEWERETAVRKIQTWWRSMRPDTIDLVKEVTIFFHFFQLGFH